MDFDQASGISRDYKRILIKSVRRSMEERCPSSTSYARYKQARLKWRPGGLRPPNNLLSLVDFVSEKGYEGQGLGNEDSNSEIYEAATTIYQICNIF